MSSTSSPATASEGSNAENETPVSASTTTAAKVSPSKKKQKSPPPSSPTSPTAPVDGTTPVAVFLEGVKKGYGKQLAPVFAKCGAETVDDLASFVVDGASLDDELNEAMIKAGARKPQINKIRKQILLRFPRPHPPDHATLLMLAVMRYEEAEAEGALQKFNSERVTKAEQKEAQPPPSSWSLPLSPGSGSSAPAPFKKSLSWHPDTVDNERERGEPDFATRLAQSKQREVREGRNPYAKMRPRDMKNKRSRSPRPEAAGRGSDDDDGWGFMNFFFLFQRGWRGPRRRQRGGCVGTRRSANTRRAPFATASATTAGA
mmetsp:Transcript_98554/g.281752  ORF Transcript_98554/g.281752 Transcript_98554/m.281752 type:complete len:317 (+) Transcript_98554:124-1074(+)